MILEKRTYIILDRRFLKDLLGYNDCILEKACLFAVNCITILASVGDRISVGKLSEMKKQNRNTTFRLQKHVLGSTSYRTNSAYTPFTCVS